MDLDAPIVHRATVPVISNARAGTLPRLVTVGLRQPSEDLATQAELDAEIQALSSSVGTAIAALSVGGLPAASVGINATATTTTRLNLEGERSRFAPDDGGSANHEQRVERRSGGVASRVMGTETADEVVEEVDGATWSMSVSDDNIDFHFAHSINLDTGSSVFGANVGIGLDEGEEPAALLHMRGGSGAFGGTMPATSGKAMVIENAAAIIQYRLLPDANEVSDYVGWVSNPTAFRHRYSYNAGAPFMAWLVEGVEVGRANSQGLRVPTGKGFYYSSTQVVGARQTGWAAATGTATRTSFATSTVTTQQLAERLKALIDDLTTHGLIGN